MMEDTKNFVYQRKGNVLSRGTILKLDQYVRIDGDAVKRKLVLLSGAPNFRKVSDFNIYGVAQPTVFGIHTVLNHIKRETKSEKISILWINMREEPVIYINRRAFVLRELEKPMKNLSAYSGAHASVIEEMEERLKQDILEEAKRNDGNILVHDEAPDVGLVACWEGVIQVETPREVYLESNSPTIAVNYKRVTFTPEKAPTPQHFDYLMELLSNLPQETQVVFNCHMGKGRSTTGMVITSLIMNYQKSETQKIMETPLTSQLKISQEKAQQNTFNNYRPITTLLKILSKGREVKSILDITIDKCGTAVNLREVISEAMNQYERSSTDSEIYLTTAVNFMSRYMFMLSFATFLSENPKIKFSDWMASRPEVTNLISELLKNPTRALQAHTAEFILRASTRTISVMNFRSGNLLTNQMILKADTLPQLLTESSTPNYDPHKPNFRELHDCKIYTLGSPTLTGIRDILSSIRSDTDEPIAWISLREEMIAFLDDRPYVLRQSSHPFHNYEVYPGINSSRLEELEAELKEELIKEAKYFQNKILTHDEINREMVPLWQVLQSKSILTTREFFNQISQTDSKFQYYRIPFFSGKPPSLQEYQQIYDIVAGLGKNGHIIFSCQMGRGPSTTGKIIAYLLKQKFGYIMKQPVEVKNEARYKCVINLQRVLNHGHVRRLEVNQAIYICSETYNLIEKIDEFRTKYLSNRVREQDDYYLERLKNFLERYFYLVVFNAYLSDKMEDPSCATKTFPEWADQRHELTSLLDEVKKNPQQSFLLESEIVPYDSKQVLRNRTGNVLTHGSLLKNDHFPGAQRTSLQPHIPGAPNFRKVDGVNVFGTGIPAVDGIRNVLNYLNCTPETQTPVIWVNLREEPVTYINQKPYVVRNSYALFSNLEFTGIDPTRVEEMEERLKQDTLEEAKRYDGRVLLHDETKDMTLYDEWQPVTPADVLTPRESYDALIKNKYPVTYVRLAITDEQSPEIQDFQQIIELVKEKNVEDIRIIFNCQMGRGRTTTALVITTLIFKLKQRTLHSLAPAVTSSPISPKSPNEEETESVVYLRGDYQVILRLVRVLTNGLQTKVILDHIIDLCSHMQNLRADINTYREKAYSETLDKNQRTQALERGINYLKRYFFLITFTAYLLEQKDSHLFEQTFGQWMTQHPELRYLLENVELN